MIEIIDIPIKDSQSWNTFVHQSPCAFPFHLYGWRGVMTDCYGYPSWYLAARDGGEICGVLPLYKVRSWLVGSSLTSLPGGICTQEPAAAEALIARAIEIGQRESVDSFILRDSRCMWGEAKGWLSVSTISTRKLPSDCATLEKELSRQIRQHIRKAQSNGVCFETGAHLLDDFYRVYSTLLHEKGVPVFSRKFLQGIAQHLAGDYTIIKTSIDGETTGAILHFALGDTLYAIWGGAPTHQRDARVTHALWWESMRYAVEKGFQFINMGRSLCGSGLQEFKERWGSTSKPVFYRAYPLHQHTVYNPLSDHCENPRYQIFTRVWQHLPMPIVQACGPLVRKHMPFG